MRSTTESAAVPASFRARPGVVALSILLAMGLAGCGPTGRSVTVYSSQDPEFAGPLLAGYAERSRVEVETKFDVESSKTVGLAQLLIREAPRPRCDLFWNNEILNTLRLKRKRDAGELVAPQRGRHPGRVPRRKTAPGTASRPGPAS